MIKRDPGVREQLGKLRRIVAAVEDPLARFELASGAKLSGINRIESDAVDEIHNAGLGLCVISGDRQRAPVWAVCGRRVGFHLVIADVVEGLHYPGICQMPRYNLARR